MLFFNELSLHSQFHERAAHAALLRAVLSARKIAESFNVPLRSTRNLLDRSIGPQLTLRDAIRSAEPTLRILASTWLNKNGPFWDEDERHPSDDYLECRQQIVTDSGLGEAAFRKLAGADAAVWSATPSDWTQSPLGVTRVVSDSQRQIVELPNFVEPAPLRSWLEAREPQLSCWADLLTWARRLSRLQLAPDAVDALRRTPFVLGAAERVQDRMLVLEQISACAEDDGQLNASGNALLQMYFVGEKAWFTDSSDQEKVDFKNALTFSDPRDPAKKVFATWHGKVKTPQLRIHYLHEFRKKEPVHVLYIGPKITKR